ncbi:MAG: hypothetical protein C5S52_00270 [ANME-2 cluster archaeon]|nr:hypothetical protein [ANME-2 cluster archaeon]
MVVDRILEGYPVFFEIFSDTDRVCRIEGMSVMEQPPPAFSASGSGVCNVVKHIQICQCSLNLGLFQEISVVLHADAVTLLLQCLADLPALSVCAVQYRDIRPVHPALKVRLDLLYDVPCFLIFIHALRDVDVFAFCVLEVPDPDTQARIIFRIVVHDKVVGHIEDPARGSETDVKGYYVIRLNTEVSYVFLDIIGVCASKGVDCLVGISDNGYIPVFPCKQLDQFKLDIVRVLKLVDDDVPVRLIDPFGTVDI